MLGTFCLCEYLMCDTSVCSLHPACLALLAPIPRWLYPLTAHSSLTPLPLLAVLPLLQADTSEGDSCGIHGTGAGFER